MTLLVLLVCIGVQRYLHFYSYSHHVNWVDSYFAWMKEKFKVVVQGHGLVGMLVLIVPLILIVSIIFAVIFHVFGVVGYLILSVAWVWYCLDSRDLHKHPYAEDPRELLTQSYQHQFAPIFWYAILGPVGLALYISILHLRNFFHAQGDDDLQSLQEMSSKVLGVMDWIPLRALGLTFALVGHFAAASKVWMKELLAGVQDDQQQAVHWGAAALEQDALTETHIADVIALIDRALLVWLVVLALISIAWWLG